jgi:hypothetical protein
MKLEEFLDNRRSLTLKMPSLLKDISSKIDCYNLPENWKGQITSLPKTVMISKSREKGISLNDLGLEDTVLDPRISNGLMISYKASMAGANNGWGVLGSNHMNKVVPYCYPFHENDIPKIGMIGISKVPIEDLLADKDISDRYGYEPIINVAVAASLTGKKWHNENSLKELKKYCRRLGSKLQGVDDKNTEILHRFKESDSLTGDVTNDIKKITSYILG